MKALWSLSKACKQRNIWKEEGLRVVFTNGCFDLLHPGHITYLQDAKNLGDVLLLGLNDDASIQRLKGPSRPLNPLQDRACMLWALKSVDMVVAFSEDTPLNLITALMPDVLVKGGDYSVETIVGAEEVMQAGGHVQVIPFLEGYSSTRLIQRIQAGV
ncbi:MAG: D-glycero-beta-D-manno-heptose 1-phosphate adenylyltransferase [Zetaproteobacteria bacterium]|nr:D-glycero-beta-D-manno-heptose 1-phosphate adenylyltransferase [Zetaproteobacteria bacterium]